MGNFGYGFKLMLQVWRDAAFADKVRDLEAGRLVPAGRARAEAPPAPVAAPRKEPRRSDAISLLAVLQREGRLVDFLKESISAYSDAQIGAAVRDVHKGCGAALDRMFALQPLASVAEGAQVEVPPGFDPAQYKLTGNVTATAPARGSLCHQGWKATKCELPDWTGAEASALVVAPMEVEVK